jgi:hypothetical protein
MILANLETSEKVGMHAELRVLRRPAEQLHASWQQSKQKSGGEVWAYD